MDQKAAQPNRLINERSPYLLQHAFNPVDWHPWGQEAFEKARQLCRPIFLSVGYATCHWCHVMERESFENQETARMLNSFFVPVKVDREEHPDLDRLYMAYVQSATGRGGWPMSVWLTPDLQPFYGGSYFPPESRYGMPGFMNVLDSVARLWETDRDRIAASARGFFERMQAAGNAGTASLPPEGKAEEACFEWLKAAFDPVWGGFGPAPKFPRPAIFTFLFSHAFHTGNREPAEIALHTLKKMAEGGIHDHLGIQGGGGGGFSRYSTDERWHLPHFEKMLYDNAQLAVSYLEAFQISGDRFFSSVAEDIFNYVLFDMRSPEGGFCSAEDADSLPGEDSTEKAEGAFYVWRWDELLSLAEPEVHLRLFARVYGMKPEGNVRYDPHGEFTGKNVLIATIPPQEAAREAGMDETGAVATLERIREMLYAEREKRPRPGRDDKIITAWNGLMISALAKGFRVLGSSEYLRAARRAADFLLERLWMEQEQRLLRRYRTGEAAISAKAEDYAFLVRALLDLYQAGFDNRYLEKAITLQQRQNELFFDRENGGYFSTATDDGTIPLRLKEEYDGAEPASSSVSVLNLLDLALITGNESHASMAESCILASAGMLQGNSHALPLMLTGLGKLQRGGILAILHGDPSVTAVQEMLHELNGRFIPGLMLLHGSASQLPDIRIPAETASGEVRPAIHLCINRACLLPASDAGELRERLRQVIP